MTESIRNAPISTWITLGTALVMIVASYFAQSTEIAVLRNEIDHLKEGDAQFKEQLIRMNEKLDDLLEAVMVHQRFRP